MNTPEKFWLQVEKTPGCWIWQGGLHNGMGIFCLNGKKEYAQRISWFLSHKKRPGKLNVFRKCRNSRCVRPEHLMAGDIGRLNLEMKSRDFIADKNGHVIPKKDFISAWNSCQSIPELSKKLGVSRSFLANGRKRLRKCGCKLREMIPNCLNPTKHEHLCGQCNRLFQCLRFVPWSIDMRVNLCARKGERISMCDNCMSSAPASSRGVQPG